jgi:hypothetical protein
MEGVNQSIDSFIPFALSHAPPDSRSLDPCFFPPFGGDGSSGREGGWWDPAYRPFLSYRAGSSGSFTLHDQFNLWDIG